MSEQTITCETWDYEKINGYDKILYPRTIAAYKTIRQASGDWLRQICRDTRPFHQAFFLGLTSPGFEYYIGRYRGQEPYCLKYYQVKVVGDNTVGHVPETVPFEMGHFSYLMNRSITDLDFMWGVRSNLIADEEKLIRVIQVAAALFVYFLEIHPYTNGNGHMSRLLVLCILARYKIYPKNWTLHPRPFDLAYGPAIRAHRNGNRKDLEALFLRCL